MAGPIDGLYTFDAEAGAKLAGASPAPGRYIPASPAAVLDDHPAAGDWQIWLFNHAASAGDLRVKVGSYYSECQARAQVTLWRVKKGRDAQVKAFDTNRRGKRTLNAPRKPGRHYLTVEHVYVPGVVECPEAKSKRIKVLPRRR